jgi:hypothetical protein
VLSASPTSIPLPGGCDVLVNLPELASVLQLTSPIGQARVPIVVPPGLAPGTLYLQAAVARRDLAERPGHAVERRRDATAVAASAAALPE